MSDILGNDFTRLLKRFNDLVSTNSPIGSLQTEFVKLEKEVNDNSNLNYRQKEAIIARCRNYSNGAYGKAKVGIKLK